MSADEFDSSSFLEPPLDIEAMRRALTKPQKQRLCKGGVPPDFTAAKTNWEEILPGFTVPLGLYGAHEFSDYTQEDALDKILQGPAWDKILVLGGLSVDMRRAWGAWFGSWGCDTRINFRWPALDAVAHEQYLSARYRYLVPFWARKMSELATEIDDIEDQLATILWIVESVMQKYIPLPKSLMNRARAVKRSLDCAELLLQTGKIGRDAKPKYAECLRQQARRKQQDTETKASLVAWMQLNWGRLIEAAQATNTWFDVGIALGPIMGWITEGMFGLARATTDNYLIAVDAVLPGYRDDYNRTAAELDAAVEKAWDQTWENLGEWDTETIADEFPGFFAP